VPVISTEKAVAPARFVAEEDDFDEEAFDEEFDEEELGEAPAEENFDEEEPPLVDPDGALPISEEIPGAPAADEEDNDEEDGETTGRFQV
jgi:hypothetical protein